MRRINKIYSKTKQIKQVIRKEIFHKFSIAFMEMILFDGIQPERGVSLRHPWAGISRVWLQVERFASFKLGNSNWISLWNDPWLDNSALSLRFPRLYRVAQLQNGLVSSHWDGDTLSWAVYFRRLLKEDEILDFQQLIHGLSSKKVGDLSASWIWKLETSGNFTVNSLFKQLTTAEALNKFVYNLEVK